jgi:hypothetical protein
VWLIFGAVDAGFAIDGRGCADGMERRSRGLQRAVFGGGGSGSGGCKGCAGRGAVRVSGDYDPVLRAHCRLDREGQEIAMRYTVIFDNSRQGLINQVT